MYKKKHRLVFVLVLFVFLIKPSFCFGQNKDKTFFSVGDVFKAVVMPDKACLWRAVTIEAKSLKKGINYIQIQGIPTNADIDSFQVSVGPSFRSFVSVEAVDVFFHKGQKMQSLEKELQEFITKKENLKAALEVCKFKLSFLKRTSINIDTINKLEKSMDIVANGLKEQKDLEFFLTDKLKSLELDIMKSKKQLQSMQAKGEEIRLDIKLFAEKIPEKDELLIVSYWNPNAGYFISYIAKILPEANQVEIISALNAWQDTKSDWNNIELSFALTSNVSSGREFIDKIDTLLSGAQPKQYFFDNNIYDAILRYDRDIKLPGQLILKAQIKNNKEYDFAKGPANVFFGGNYAGKAVFGPCRAGQAVEISFLYQDCDTVTQKNITDKKDTW